MTEYTPEKVADLIAEANGVSTNAVVANPRRCRNMIGQLADALEAMVKDMHARELHHFEEEQARAKAEAERDEALAAIREALAFESILPAIASEPRRILSRITDKEKN